MSLLRFVALSLPKAIVFENVRGLACKDGDADKSPLDIVVSELQALEYSVAPIFLDLQSFHDVVRSRTCPSGCKQ